MGRSVRQRLIGTAALVLCLAADAGAQYFGRNKVQYDRENILVLATEHFDIYYSREDASAASLAARLAERWYARLSKALGHSLRGRQPIVLYGSHRRFEQTNVYGGLIDESTGGFTDSRKRRIVMPFAASLAETDHVLGHELVHAFQFDIADQARTSLAVPLWFVEGMAEYLTLGADDPQTTMWMRDAVASRKLPSIGDLGAARYFPYRWGAALWSHLAREFGEDLPARALRAKRDVRRRLEALTGRSLAELTADWHASLEKQHARPGALGEPAAPLISSRAHGGRLNLAAALSPDGRRLVFLSERDQFSIDLFLADASTGRVIRKLLTTAANPQFESLHYLHSAGAWNPAGSRFALATINSGRPMLLIIDIDGGSRARELPLPDVDEASSPTWSPDGSSIAFSAVKNGVSDLFVVDLATQAVRQLTDDMFADLQPSWSPDGGTVAFTTDRFTTSLARLTFGAYRIGLLDVPTAAVSPAPPLPDMHQIDPAWGPGGNSLYFVGAAADSSNVYRLDRTTGALFQITEVHTGVSGVARLSPVLSAASAAGTLAFSIFRNGGYEVHTMDREAARSTRLPVSTPVPQGAASRAVVDGIAPVMPLPMPLANMAKPRQYRPKLSLEGVGSPYFSAGGGPLGSYVSGGASLLFGDLLGDQQLLTALYLSSRLDESSIGALYVNRKFRWNWGVTLEQTPELRLRTRGVDVDPERAQITRERERMLWTNRHVGGFAAFPFDRFRRLEVSAGFRQLAFERERRTELISARSGMLVDHDTQPLPSEPSIGMADAGVALVGDSAVFGATGPLLGTRYRFQASANIGGLTYTNVLADYRRYVMPFRPFTLAVRLLHSGRYGGDASDSRLRDAYVGSSTLVRGYSPGDVARSECGGAFLDCPALNTLLANRIAAAKIELRVPLWSTLTTTSRVRYGAIPIDAFVFADAGAGWGGEQRFGRGGSDGKFVRSLGAGLRANALGLILEAAAVRPLDLRHAGWTFGFNLRPAF